MYARVSFYEMGNASRDDAVRAFEQATGPVEEMEGNEGGMLLVSPSGDKAITVTLWESEQALRNTEAQANRVREQAAGSSGMTIREVEPYEVAFEFGKR